MRPEDYEFYDDWVNRDEEERGIGLDDFDEMRSIEEYGENSYFDDDDDSDDPY